MTIRDLFMSVTKQVTEFLKIPMYEMTSDEFYTLYMDANGKELGVYKPLESPKKTKLSLKVED